MRPVSQEQAKPAEQSALEESLMTLLRGIQDHLTVADLPDAEGFRTQLAVLGKQFNGPDGARQIVASVVDVLSKYGSRVNHLISQQKSGAAAATSELAKAIQKLSGMQGNAERLARVEDQIKAITPKDNLEVAKARLCADVAVARAEALQERQKVGALFTGMIGKLNPPELALRIGEQAQESGYQTDQLTGLPTRGYAESELTRAHAQTADCFLALFVVKRLGLINAKFGYARGDEVLLRVVGHLAQSLPDFKNLFRWAPCAFISLAPPGLPYKELRSKIQIIELSRLTPTLEWQGRSAMVPVVMDCRIVSVKDFTTPADLFLRLDTLASDS